MKPLLFVALLLIVANTALTPMHKAYAAPKGPFHPLVVYDFTYFDELYATHAMSKAERPQLLLKSDDPPAQAVVSCAPVRHGGKKQFFFSNLAWPSRELRIKVYDFQLGGIGIFHFGRFRDSESCFDYLRRMEADIRLGPVRISFDLFDDSAEFPIVSLDQKDRFFVKRGFAISSSAVQQ